MLCVQRRYAHVYGKRNHYSSARMADVRRYALGNGHVVIEIHRMNVRNQLQLSGCCEF